MASSIETPLVFKAVLRLKKYDGEFEEGKEPIEVLEKEVEIPAAVAQEILRRS